MALVVLASAVINLVGNIALIPPFGMWGAAWSTVVSYAFMAVLMGIVAGRQYPIPQEWRRIGTLAGCCAAILAVNLGVVGHGSPARIAIKAGLVLLLPLLLLASGFWNAEEKLRARLFVRRLFRVR